MLFSTSEVGYLVSCICYQLVKQSTWPENRVLWVCNCIWSICCQKKVYILEIILDIRIQKISSYYFTPVLTFPSHSEERFYKTCTIFGPSLVHVLPIFATIFGIIFFSLVLRKIQKKLAYSFEISNEVLTHKKNEKWGKQNAMFI